MLFCLAEPDEKRAYASSKALENREPTSAQQSQKVILQREIKVILLGLRRYLDKTGAFKNRAKLYWCACYFRNQWLIFVIYTTVCFALPTDHARWRKDKKKKLKEGENQNQERDMDKELARRVA